MKNFKSVLATISLIVLSSPCLTLGQGSPKNFYISSRVSFDSLTENIEIKLPVVQNESLGVIIRSNIYEGELSLEFYDAKGEKQGNFYWKSITFCRTGYNKETLQRISHWRNIQNFLTIQLKESGK